jgi:hypothetical protein
MKFRFSYSIKIYFILESWEALNQIVKKESYDTQSKSEQKLFYYYNGNNIFCILNILKYKTYFFISYKWVIKYCNYKEYFYSLTIIYRRYYIDNSNDITHIDCEILMTTFINKT